LLCNVCPVVCGYLFHVGFVLFGFHCFHSFIINFDELFCELSPFSLVTHIAVLMFAR
jgi:hypothetical protein